MRERFITAGLFTFALLTILFLPSASGGWEKIVLDLNQCIMKAVEISPEIEETRYDVQVYESKKIQADAARYPQIEFLAITGPSPRARGDQVSSPDDSTRPVISGIFGNAEVTLIQPIYTFGKISSLREAAYRGINVSKAGVNRKSSDIVLRTKELYYGLLLAKDMKNLVLEIKDELVRSIEKVEKQLQIGSPWADEVDLYKLKAFLGETDKSLNEAEKGIALAKDALMTSIGLPGGTEFDIADSTLSPDERLPDDVRKYIMEAVEFRPEFIQLKEGLIARKALVDVEKSNYYPQLFLGFRGSIAGASNRDRIENPFIFDYFNHSYGAVFLGVKWAVDFGITKGKVREAEAEHNKLLEKKRFADEGIPFQVRKVYLEIEEAKKNIAATEEAYRNARKWLIAAVANFDLGIGEAKEVADAAVAYARMKANHLRSIYNQKLSFANLLYATGTDLKELK